MRRTPLTVMLLTLPLLARVARADDALTIVRDGKSDYSIVIAHGAPAPTARGAAELQTYISRISGAKLPIVDDAAPRPAHAILVGPSAYTASLDAAKLGDEGFVIRTSNSSAGDSITIAGPGVRGSMYGCSAFLESLGVRWFTPKVERVPSRPTITIAPADTTNIPAFEYREPFFTEAMDKDWATRNRINGSSEPLDASTGGKIAYAEFVHTFDTLIPQSLYGTHPEYFPLIDGKRVNGYTQRCLTNPEVLKLAVEGVRRAFKEHPEAMITSVSQNDTAGWCQCENCKRLTGQYGAHSGLYLWFVNQVAEQIEKEMPGKLIDTLAYQFTEAPPKGIAPRANVRIRLCPISVCEAHPYEHDDAPPTKAFVANLGAWSTITSTLYIWHYNTDFAHYLMPFPDFAEFPADLKLYQRSGVKGVFFEGDIAPGGGASDAELRSYVMAKLLWNPSQDADALVTEWLQGVYPNAWKPMRAWFDLMHKQVASPERHLGIYDPPKPEIFTPEVLDQGDKLFDQAAALAATPLEKEYVEKSRLGLRYVRLVQHPSDDEVLSSFLADARRFGITQLREGQPIEEWERAYREGLKKK